MIKLPPEVKFPVLARPKLRGVRCVILHGEPLIKVEGALTPVPNRPIADILSGLPAFDGMIVVGNVLQAECNVVTSEAVMSITAAPEFTYHVIDLVTTGKYSFEERYKMYREYARACRKNIQPVWHKLIEDLEALDKFEKDTLFGHYPGIVVRDPQATKGGIWSS